MSDALNTYGDYARLIFFLLAGRATIESHTIAVYTTSQTIGITRGHRVPILITSIFHLMSNTIVFLPQK
jgi:hypothetical protein